MILTPRYYTKHQKKGFTLIEVLVVIVIISIVASFAVLALNSYFNSRQINNAAEELSIKIPAAQRQAIIQFVNIGLLIQPHAYAFYQFIPAQGQWQILQADALLAPTQLGDSVSLSVNKNIQPQIIFSPTGDQTAFHLIITAGGHQKIIVGDGAGNLSEK